MSSLSGTTHDSPFTISDLCVPDTIDSPDAEDFKGMAEVRRLVEAEELGAGAESFTAEEMLPSWSDSSSPMAGLIAKIGGRIVARGSVSLPIGAGECWVSVGVLPEFRLRGIGSALYSRLEQLAKLEARTIIQNQTAFPAGVGGTTIAAPTGFGFVPAGLGSTRFLQHHGFALEQVGRLGGLRLPLDAETLASLRAAALAAARGYDTVSWQGPTPEEWVADFALMRTRMSTDTPNAGVEQTEDVWTAERVRAVDELWASSPRVLVTTAVRHRKTGKLVGYTELDVPAESNRPVEQADTFVLASHRGHRLGMLLKLINLRELAARFPENNFVTTMNAEDNRHMLEVNEALGFQPVSFAARWKKYV
jgi:GNAT superfamily N-acetyltransferase